MKNVKPPQFLSNLYRDMRDRHLLLPALALVIGTLAVPIVLKSHNDAHMAATASSNGGSQANSAIPAVVRQELGVTNYKERLDRLESKNPFHQQYTSTPESAAAQAAPSASAPSTSSSTPSSSSTSVPPPTTSSPSISPSPSTSSPTPSTSGSTGSPDTSTPTPKPSEPTLYAFRVSIAIGEPGDLKRRDNVSQGVVLPSKNKPMLAFIGATEDMSTATFVVADTIDDVQGGRCVPSKSSCSLLQLKPGEEAHLHYEPQNRRYNLKLIGIGLAPVKASADTSSPSQKRAKSASVDGAIGGFPSTVGYGTVK
jgi:hypothetical protein